MPTKKTHQADIYEAARAAECTRFMLFCYSGPFNRYRENHDSLQAARDALPAFEAAHCKYGRKAVIYGLHTNGASYLIL